MAKILVLLADGLEMCEALLAVDIWRRAKLEVVTASLNENKKVLSSHKVVIEADETLDEASNRTDDFDMVFLPGGKLGSQNLENDHRVRSLCEKFAKEGKTVSAICAAPSVLAAFGLLKGKKASVHPAFKDKLESFGAIYSPAPITIDGIFITGEALGASFGLSFAILERFSSPETITSIKFAICYR